MAQIALVTANKVSVVESIEQMTLPTDEAVLAGAAVRLNTTSGKFTNANGTTAPEARIYGVATKTVASGENVTAIRKGVMDGFNFSQAYDAAIYLSDTEASSGNSGLGDAAGTTPVVVGRVIPGTATPIGTAFDKMLFIDL